MLLTPSVAFLWQGRFTVINDTALAPKFSSPAAGAYESGSILLMLSNRRLSILLFRFSLLLERNLRDV